MKKTTCKVPKEKITIEPKEKEGYVRDFVSGYRVKAIPEEVEAVQVFSKQLVEDYGYPKEFIQTRPQYRVRQRPSGGKEFPVDIFENKQEFSSC